MKCAVIVTAAGSSNRFNTSSTENKKKEFSMINGQSVLEKAVRPFLSFDFVKLIAITYRKGFLEETKKAVENLSFQKEVLFIEGGETRRESVFNALKQLYLLKDKPDFVAIHDAARPFVSEALIERTFEKAIEKGCASPAVKVNDSVVSIDRENKIIKSIERSSVRALQTPQIFSFPDIYFAHVKACECDKEYTDDTQIFSDFGKTVYLVEGDPENRKITYSGDIAK